MDGRLQPKSPSFCPARSLPTGLYQITPIKVCMKREQHPTDEGLKKWHTRLALELNTSDRTFDRLYEILVDMKSSGIEKDTAYEVLKSLLQKYPKEPNYDLILDLMDVVTGYCSPQDRIWE